MDVPAAAAWLWIVVGVGLAILLLTTAALVARAVARRRVPAPPPAGDDDGHDDLPGFLDRPPGSAGTPDTRDGWAALSSTPAAVAEVPPAAPGRRTDRLLVATAAAAALLVVAAVVVGVATARHDRRADAGAVRFDGTPPRRHDWAHQHPRRGGPLPTVPAAPTPGQAGAGALADATLPLGRSGLAAELTFGGVVLEPHAVGVTATYPRVRLTSDGTDAVAHVELPAYNCLAAAAPADPVAAHCTPTTTEYADLPSPALTVTRSRDGRVQLTGRFATYVRPNGTAPDWTGRVYALQITVTPAERRDHGRVPATGELRLGADRAATTGVSVLRLG
ncbi:MAG TPA: hypothetical protein VGN28_15475 [Blastococcus sp.]|nr:hypothetical protein [Blastococcus sp.]